MEQRQGIGRSTEEGPDIKFRVKGKATLVW